MNKFKYHTTFFWALVITLSASSLSILNASELKLRFDTTELLPAANGTEHQPGLAGPFTGVNHDVVIMAGGANFPDGVPWHPKKDGTKSYKTYHNAIYILSEDKNGKKHW